MGVGGSSWTQKHGVLVAIAFPAAKDKTETGIVLRWRADESGASKRKVELQPETVQTGTLQRCSVTIVTDEKVINLLRLHHR